MKYKIPGIIILLVIIIQFIPYGKNHTNPSVVAEPAWDSPQTRALFFRACSDCHSNETTWPWYSNVAPGSWLIQHDVNEGREHFNISKWGVQNRNEGDEAAEEVKEGEMPPWFYVIAHSHAGLSKNEKDQFIAGLLKTFNEEKKENEPESENESETGEN